MKFLFFATNTKSRTKTNKYKDSSGTVLYTLSISGTFSYTGSTSTCTSAPASATANDWTVISKNASKSGNKASAKGIFNQHYNNMLVQTKTHSITLTCSTTGSLS